MHGPSIERHPEIYGDAVGIEKLQRLCLANHCLIQQLDQQLGRLVFSTSGVTAKLVAIFWSAKCAVNTNLAPKQIYGPYGFKFDLTVDPIVYAIINCTPDSFMMVNRVSGQIMTIEAGLANGAVVIEVGGKSTRGLSEITPDEEWQRLHP